MMTYISLISALTFFAFGASADTKKDSVIQWDEVACEKAVVSTPPDSTTRNAYALAADIQMRRMKANLEVLTGEKLLEDGVALEDREDPFARSIAREILSNMIRANGLRPQMELVPEGANIFTEIKGKTNPDEVIELIAHYDSVGNPGADDNGSGVALLLELSRIAAKMSFERTLRFVFTDLEEDKRQGVTGHVQLLQGGKDKVVAALVVDTIAWASKEKPRSMAVVEVGTSEMHATGAYGRQVELAQRIAYLIGRFPVSGTVDFSFETSGSEPNTADHGVYWKAGIPAVLIGQANESGLLNPDYHKATDQIKNFNWDYYLNVSRQVGGIAFALAGYQSASEPSKAVADKLGELEQTQVVISSLLPQPLNRALYRTKPTYTSSGGSFATSERKEFDDLMLAIEKYPALNFVVGKLPPYASSSTDRVFAIDFDRNVKWEFYGLDLDKAKLLIDTAASRGIATVMITSKTSGKSDTLLVSDTAKMFLEKYHADRSYIFDRMDLEYVKAPPLVLKPELSPAAKALLEETGILNFSEKGRLILIVLDQEPRKGSPFIIMDPASRGIIARANLLENLDIESMRMYFESELDSPTLILEPGRDIKDEEALRTLAAEFLAAFNREPGAKKFEFVVVGEDSKAKDK